MADRHSSYFGGRGCGDDGLLEVVDGVFGDDDLVLRHHVSEGVVGRVVDVDLCSSVEREELLGQFEERNIVDTFGDPLELLIGRSSSSVSESAESVDIAEEVSYRASSVVAKRIISHVMPDVYSAAFVLPRADVSFQESSSQLSIDVLRRQVDRKSLSVSSDEDDVPEKTEEALLLELAAGVIEAIQCRDIHCGLDDGMMAPSDYV